MKRKLILALMLTLLSISLASCVKEQILPPSKPSLSLPDGTDQQNPDETDTPTEDEKEESEGSGTESGTEEVVDPLLQEFKVTMHYESHLIKPNKNDDILAIWDNTEGQVVSKPFVDGVSTTKGLDGDYFVHLNKAPMGYTYDPNNQLCWVNNDFREMDIKLFQLTETTGSGNSLRRPIKMQRPGYYQAKLESASTKVYYQFIPQKPGTYYFESLVDAYNDNINPQSAIHISNPQFVNPIPNKTIDTGGFSRKGGYTKNFKFKFEVRPDELGNAYTFGISCQKKNGFTEGETAVVDFLCLHSDEYEINIPNYGAMVRAKETDKALVTINTRGKTLYNADGGTGSYYNTGFTNANLDRKSVLDGSKFKYKEDEGIYYLYENGRYITPLLCYINIACPFYEPRSEDGDLGALINVQMLGNTALTVRDEEGNKLNYTKFIEEQYMEVGANRKSTAPGMVYVTKEMKDFLQRYAIRNLLFKDGFGWCENFGVYSNGDDMWLWDCAYYL